MEHTGDENLILENENIILNIDLSQCFDWFNKKVYALSKAGSKSWF